MTELARDNPASVPGDQTLTSASGPEGRWESRRRSKYPAIIVVDATGVGIKCTTNDISSAGAMLELATTSNINDKVPDTFSLYIPSDRMMVSCKVAWREKNTVGVRFISPMRVQPPAPKRTIAKAPEKPRSRLGWPFKK